MVIYGFIESIDISPFREEDGVFLKEYLEINGVKQGLMIEGENRKNPVLLFLHGGPGFPIYPLVRGEKLNLHKYFTVCYWDQRGTGMSYYKPSLQQPLALEQLKTDTLALTNYLLEKFDKEKIYIMGHSWGSFLGSIIVGSHPEFFHAYIGTGQVGDQTESEKETRDFLWRMAQHREDKRAMEEIRHIEVDQFYYKNQAYGKLRDKYLIQFGGGMMRENFSNGKLMKYYLRCKEYKMKERLNVLRGAMNSFPLIQNLAMSQLIHLIPEMKVPIFILQGKYDYETTHNQAKKYIDEVKAPSKHFYTFENSAHSPFLEEKQRFYHIIENDILKIPKTPRNMSGFVE
ncbi:alpha/beta fold hydrolase [Oceanobacillus senegalensis]|uniref:alpha/beta fold hydrolase n=1 Tax=Oceanobacillus senegalensis TaxID=1936063 RepID=UPI000A30E335|nr:alpha/beta hydrolase [Oceanobacillus senegalensis]